VTAQDDIELAIWSSQVQSSANPLSCSDTKQQKLIPAKERSRSEAGKVTAPRA